MNGAKQLSILTWVVVLLVTIHYGSSEKAGTELTPCQTAALLPVIRKEFTKLIPVFDPDRFTIRLDGERAVTIRSTDSSLNPFLIRYYTMAVATINDLEARNTRIRDPMLLVFNNYYVNFLTQTGVPMSCVSFYAGRSDFQSVVQVGQLAASLRKSFGIGQSARNPPSATSNRLKNQGVGLELVRKLGLTSTAFVVKSPADNNLNCDPIFIKVQDGSILTNLPSVTLPPTIIKIPGEPSPINTQGTNVTYLLAGYISTGLTCLDSIELKGNFSSSVCNWLSSKLIPTLIGSSSCVSGFPGILNLLKSLETYVLGLRNPVEGTRNQDAGSRTSFGSPDLRPSGFNQQSQRLFQQTFNLRDEDTFNGDRIRTPEDNIPIAGRLYAPAPWDQSYSAPPQRSQIRNDAVRPNQFSNTQQQNDAAQPLAYDEPVPSPPEFGEYAPLHQPPVPPPLSDGFQNEVYKLHPKFNYELRDAQALTGDNEAEDHSNKERQGDEPGSKEGTSPLVYAGVGSVILLIIMCCVCPLVYFLCPPSLKNISKGKKKILKWIRKRIPPERNDHEPKNDTDGEESVWDKDGEEEPLLPKSILKKPKRQRKSKSKHTRVKVKLNEDYQVSEVSVEESTESSLSDDQAGEYDVDAGDIDDELDIGGLTRTRRASLPETHSYGARTPRTLAFESTASGTSNSDLYEEDEVSHRYDSGPRMDPSSPSTKRTQEDISSRLAAVSGRLTRPGSAVPVTPTSKAQTVVANTTKGTAAPTPKYGTQSPVNTRRSSEPTTVSKPYWTSTETSAQPSPPEVSRKSSKNFYENTMVKWDDS